MDKKVKEKFQGKIRFIHIILLLLGMTGIVCVLSGYGSERIEHNVWQIKDEAAIYTYQPQPQSGVEYDSMVVCIDPGHGGEDPGTMAGEKAEKDENLKLALRVKENLEKYNIKVILTREDDTFVSLKKRAKIANEEGADLFVSLHRNNLENYQKVNGIDIYINSAGTEDDYKIGNALYEALSGVNGMKVNEPRRGSATDENENYIVVRRTKMTACLVEMGYMSNERDNAYFEDYLNSYSIAIAEAIVNYLQ